MNIVMIGAGYVGLVSAACFAEFGTNVICVDTDSNRIAKLRDGHVPIYEPGLNELVQRNLQQGRLQFTCDSKQPVAAADLVFIAVGTPSRRCDGHAELSYVYSAVREIAVNLQGYTLVVNKSTVPVGTAREVQGIIRQHNPDADFDVASNPEFLREGAAISDFMRPDRVVIGVESEQAMQRLQDLYRPLNLIEVPIVFTNLESAELSKYAANAFLATKISFINEMASLCEQVGADVHHVAKSIGLDKRIGRKFLHAGPGYGGSCFPKDTLALVRTARENGISCRIVEATMEINVAQRQRMVQKIRKALGGNEAGMQLAILGLTFKPETDDMREAPSVAILPPLHEKGAIIRVHDPFGMQEAEKILPDGIVYCDDIESAITNADAVVLLTEWNLYRGLDLRDLKRRMRGNIFIDLRNVYELKDMVQAGLQYVCVGRPGSA